MINKLNNKIIICLIIVLIIIYSFIGPKGDLVENLEIPIGIGYDLEKQSKNNVTYSIPLPIYLFQPSKTDSTLVTGVAKSLGETREDRQIKIDKTFLLGMERVLLVSEDYAEYGIRNIIDILLISPQANDTALMAVCKGKSEDIFNHKVKGYSNSAEFIEGLIKNSKQFNFFPESEYSLMNAIVRIDAEGRNLALPYIELIDEDIKLTGLALFKRDKMIAKTNIEEAKLINILKNNKAKGMLTIQDSSKKYINFYAESKRKVKCYKEDNKFKFTIALDLNSTIVNNTLYSSLKSDPKLLEETSNNIAENFKKTCENFITNKIKSQYKADILGLGKFAAGKYGRGKGIDWDKVVSESIIEVNVTVKVDNQGRGDY
ncbi:Ger(x)C family spore germination protein [Clostridium sp. PL3]|uniref:Ger(X)C family spore germination protein n=1 Tax=Clostridium thailandense TaxID=2794346 RepID=A0A949TUD1_9CLOT|nr:Ger(x)C family spore germination protein [Clostridium thailandense]MBV7272558.1 Ger(x)C family spore germination protein [Clostridium thailandense]